MVHRLVPAEVEHSEVVHKQVVSFVDGVKAIELVVVDKLVQLVSSDPAGLGVALLDEPYLQVAAEHLLHQPRQLLGVHIGRAVGLRLPLDEVQYFGYFFLLDVEVVLGLRFCLIAELLIMF